MGETVKKAEAAIARVEAMGEAAGKLFTQFDPERIRKDAEVAEARIAAADRPLPLSGLLVSVKDLYDEAGQRSTALRVFCASVLRRPSIVRSSSVSRRQVPCPSAARQ